MAQALAAGRKDFAVLLCSEEPLELPEDAWPQSLPHLPQEKIEELKQHYLGCVTWKDIVHKLCPDLELPDKIDNAIPLCLPLLECPSNSTQS